MPAVSRARLTVADLGVVRAWIDGVEIDLGPARQRAVFTVLATRAGRPVTRDDLTESIWGSQPPATAAGNIYTYMSGLRRSLGAVGDDHPGSPLLTSDSLGYAVHVRPDDVDSKRFRALCKEAGKRQAAGDLAAAHELLGQALRLWRGDPYTDLRGDHFDLERADLTQLKLKAKPKGHASSGSASRPNWPIRRSFPNLSSWSASIRFTSRFKNC